MVVGTKDMGQNIFGQNFELGSVPTLETVLVKAMNLVEAVFGQNVGVATYSFEL